MFAQGYIHSQDIAEDMHDKKAYLKGVIEGDMFTQKKDDEVVKIVCKGDMRGYKTPKMRTRYYSFTLDSDLFIKLI